MFEDLCATVRENEKSSEELWEIRSIDGLVSLGRVGRFPALERECIEGGRIKDGYVVNLGGQRFVTDPDITVESGCCVLIMSADAGG